MAGKADRMLVILALALLPACQPAATGGNPYGPYRTSAGAARALNDLSPEDRQRVLSNAEELRNLSGEERQWLRDHPEAARKLGDLSPEERQALRERFESLPPAQQEEIRRNPEKYLQ